MRRYLGFLLVILFLAGLLFFAGHRIFKRPPVVLVGPVNLIQGRSGLVARGMTRDELIGFLGPPLYPRETMEQAGSYDPISTDYFAGIYADVHWYGDDTVSGLTFKLDKFARIYGSELKVYLQFSGKTVLLSRDINLAKASSSKFISELGLKKSQVYVGEDLLFIKPTGDSVIELRFSQSDSHLLSYVGINL